uniref:Uncharacterized protein n=1 Tax=Arundo donax TaxID=35708 RepID=A0A0A9DHC1_ARUDO
MWFHLHHSNGKAFLIDCTVLIHSWHDTGKCVRSSTIFSLSLNISAIEWPTTILVFCSSGISLSVLIH